MVLIRALLFLLLAALYVGVSVVVGWFFAEHPDEDGLLWKLAGYGLLCIFTASVNHVTVPLGYIIALHLAARCRVNAGARRAAATAAFVMWLIGVFF